MENKENKDMEKEEHLEDFYEDVQGYEACFTMSRSCIIYEIINSITFTCER